MNKKYFSIPSTTPGQPDYLREISSISSLYNFGTFGTIYKIIASSITKSASGFNMDIAGDLAASGTTTEFLNTTAILTDSNADFIADGIEPGDFVSIGQFSDQNLYVVSVTNATSIVINDIHSLRANGAGIDYRIFKPLGPIVARGEVTSEDTNKLIDTNADFVAAGLQPGDVVKNLSTGGETAVVSIDSPTQLTLKAETMYANQLYSILTASDAKKPLEWLTGKWEETLNSPEGVFKLDLTDAPFNIVVI
jgi:hypothetical protein